MVEFVTVEEAKQRSGLRLVLLGGAPSPWGEAAKGIIQVKRLPFVAVRLIGGETDTALREWTGVDNAPVVMYENEQPRSGWAEILLLAERLAPRLRLIPEEAEQRALLFGLAHEICGEMGLGWCRRLTMVQHALDSNTPYAVSREVGEYLGAKYGYRLGIEEAALSRVIEVLTMLSARLRDQHQQGSRFFLGESLTALDIYWATMATGFAPFPPHLCPMSEPLRGAFEYLEPPVEKALDPILIEHREFIYREYLELPIQL